MCSIVTSVLKDIFGFLLNKFRDHAAGKLKEGDSTDEKCRQLIVRELDDINTKLDGLARKDLRASISFFKEGMGRLNMCLDTFTDDATPPFAQQYKKDVAEAQGLTIMEARDSNNGRNSVFTEPLALSEAKKQFRITPPKRFTSALSSTTTEDCGSERRVNRIFNQALALSQAIATLNVSTGNRFASTKLSFEKANEKATEAFSNEALSTEDRILAARLRVMSRILESLDDPDAAVVVCKVYLEELHDMPAVKKMFAVQFKGGVKSLFNKTKRVENVKSVFVINFVLFNFIKTFTTKAAYLSNWPQIDLEEISMHPMTVTAENDIINEIEKSGVQVPNLIPSAYLYNVLTVNSKGEIIAWEQPSVVLIKSRDDIQDFCRLPKEDTEASGFYVYAMTIVGEDNVYIVTMSKQTHNGYCYKLFVYDTNGKIKQQLPLEFLNGLDMWYVSDRVAGNKDKNIIILHRVKDENRIFVCDNSGQLKYSFPVENCIKYLSISHKKEIITASYGDTVYIYTEEGDLKQTFKLPRHHLVRGVAFDHINEKIIVCTWNYKTKGYCLLNYSDIDKKPQILSLHSLSKPTIISHPNGPVALVHRRGIIFI